MLSTREFIKGGLLAAAGMAAGDAAAKEPAEKGIRFCVFADIHYHPGTFPHSTKEWLGRILEHAAAEGCEFIIHCGDFCHNTVAYRDYVDYYNGFRLPTYHAIGNHDDDGTSHEETLKAYGLKQGHYFFDRGGFRFIVADPNYVRWGNGTCEHYSRGNYFRMKRERGDRIGVMPPEQLEWLRRTIDESPYPCVTFSHQSFERPTGSACENYREVQAIFDAANAKSPGKVRLAINGHHHCDNIRVHGQVVYFDLNSASYQWIGERLAHTKYPEDWRKANLIRQERTPFLAWDDPVHAIVTLTPSGGMKIEGMKSRFSCGVRPEDVGVGLDPCARLTTPDVQSADFTFRYA